MRIRFGDNTINIVIISMALFKFKIGLFIIVILKIIIEFIFRTTYPFNITNFIYVFFKIICAIKR